MYTAGKVESHAFINSCFCQRGQNDNMLPDCEEQMAGQNILLWQSCVSPLPWFSQFDY